MLLKLQISEGESEALAVQLMRPLSDPAIPPILRDDIGQPTYEPTAGRRLRHPRRPPAPARLQPAGQFALDRATSAGHSHACSAIIGPGDDP
jgi:hypothetical protein